MTVLPNVCPKLHSGFRDDFDIYFCTIRYMFENLKTSQK